jgi:hypothetical protein
LKRSINLDSPWSPHQVETVFHQQFRFRQESLKEKL